MTTTIVIDFANLLFAGMLAGALFVIDYGVGRALVAVTDAQSQILMRQALIRSLRIMVPVLFILTILTGIAAVLVNGADAGFGVRLAGVVMVIVCFVLALTGTAPINQAIVNWQPSAPPANWQAMILQWERLDKARTWAGIIAFALMLTAMAINLAAH